VSTGPINQTDDPPAKQPQPRPGEQPSSARVLTSTLTVSQRGPVTLLGLSRAAKRNALDETTIAGLETFFSDPPKGTRVVVLFGEGRHFSAGADLHCFDDTSTWERVLISTAWHRAFDRIENGCVPVVAALQGGVIGGGLELAASAHIRVAERNAYYALPEGMRGLFVGGGGAVRIPRLIGTSRMTDMMLTGRTYSAEEGVSLGFSQYLVDDGFGLAKAIELAEQIATNTTLSNFATAQALPRIARASPDGGFLMEALMAAVTIGDEEAKARIAAFFEKRARKVTHIFEEGASW
jgi:enoyl-CoA hydratase/carnithine racemase